MLIESITLAQRDNKELEALIYRFRPLIRKCGRQLHIEDGEQEMVVAFIELIKRFRPERLRSQDDGKVVQYIKNAMNYSCFKIYKKHHNPIATIISLEEITVKEEAAYLTRQRPEPGYAIGPDISAGFTYGEGAYCYFSNVREKHKCSGYRTALGM